MTEEIDNQEWYVVQQAINEMRGQQKLWSFWEDCARDPGSHIRRSGSQPGERLILHKTCARTKACFQALFDFILNPSFKRKAIDFIASLLFRNDYVTCKTHGARVLHDQTTHKLNITHFVREFVRWSCPTFVQEVFWDKNTPIDALSTLSIPATTRLLVLYDLHHHQQMNEVIRQLCADHPNLHIIVHSVCDHYECYLQQQLFENWKNVCSHINIKLYRGTSLSIIEQEVRIKISMYLFGVMRLVCEDFKEHLVLQKHLQCKLNADIIKYILRPMLL